MEKVENEKILNELIGLEKVDDVVQIIKKNANTLYIKMDYVCSSDKVKDYVNLMIDDDRVKENVANKIVNEKGYYYNHENEFKEMVGRNKHLNENTHKVDSLMNNFYLRNVLVEYDNFNWRDFVNSAFNQEGQGQLKKIYGNLMENDEYNELISLSNFMFYHKDELQMLVPCLNEENTYRFVDNYLDDIITKANLNQENEEHPFVKMLKDLYFSPKYKKLYIEGSEVVKNKEVDFLKDNFAKEKEEVKKLKKARKKGMII